MYYFREREKFKKTRETFFCIGFSSIWTTPIHKILHDLRNKYNLKWLRPAMSYHKFSNLREKFSADLTGKIMQGIEDKDWLNFPCNCYSASKRSNGECLYQGKCRNKTLIYEVKCKITGQAYIGKTQRNLKVRIGEHITSAIKVIQTGRRLYGDNWKGSGGYDRSTALSKYLANLCRDCTDPDQVRKRIRELIEVNIVWQGNRIQCMKTACTLVCKLCMAERLEIYSRWQKDKQKLLNDRSKIFGSCTCKTGFHRFTCEVVAGTDESREATKKSTTELSQNQTQPQDREEQEDTLTKLLRSNGGTASRSFNTRLHQSIAEAYFRQSRLSTIVEDDESV